MRTDEFDYHLPPRLIAQAPGRRGDSRLLVVYRGSGRIEHHSFSDLPDFLEPGDLMVLNDTRVTARRLRALRETGQEAEVVLLRPVGEQSWQALVRPGRSMRPGRTVILLGENGERASAELTGITSEGGRELRFSSPEERDMLAHWGAAPLPPYIHAPLARTQEDRYQTVYATHAGSAAAPTAGLHFTSEMLQKLEARGVSSARVTLDVGVGTFRPVKSATIEEHEMHSEKAVLSAETASRINAAPGRLIAVGTTSVRTLESAAGAAEQSGRATKDRVVPFAGATRLFITPGYVFRAVDALITNFHMPCSTLLMLVSAFAGMELTREAYGVAIEREYRFFSFGDAMLIL